MTWIASLLLALMLGLTPPADSTPADVAATPAFTTADELLDAVSASDAKINTLQTTIRYETVQALLDDTQVRKGTAVLSISPDRNLKQFRVSFTQFISSRGIEEQSRDYIFDGHYLVERLNEEKHFIKREVVRPGQEVDPLAIDGPLPLPIGQTKALILKRFTATLLDRESSEASARLAGCYRLRLSARRADDDLETVDLWYHPQTLLPGRALITQRGGDTVQVDLANTTINTAEIKPEEFSTATPSLKDGWRVDIQPLDERKGP